MVILGLLLLGVVPLAAATVPLLREVELAQAALA